MPLSEPQKKMLRGLGHQLKPVITVGDSGLSESLLREFNSTIDHHELIKVRFRVGERKTRDQMIGELCTSQNADLVKRIGNVALIFRRNEEKPKISLPAK